MPVIKFKGLKTFIKESYDAKVPFEQVVELAKKKFPGVNRGYLRKVAVLEGYSKLPSKNNGFLKDYINGLPEGLTRYEARDILRSNFPNVSITNIDRYLTLNGKYPIKVKKIKYLGIDEYIKESLKNGVKRNVVLERLLVKYPGIYRTYAHRKLTENGYGTEEDMRSERLAYIKNIKGKTFEEISKILVKKFGVSESVAYRDIKHVFPTLPSKRLQNHEERLNFIKTLDGMTYDDIRDIVVEKYGTTNPTTINLIKKALPNVVIGSRYDRARTKVGTMKDHTCDEIVALVSKRFSVGENAVREYVKDIFPDKIPPV